MEVASAMDFDFNSPAYPIAPSTPKRIGFNQLSISGDHHQPNPSPATVPFAWEEKPGVPKSFYNFFQNNLSFNVSHELHTDSGQAEDLLAGGVIKPLPHRREKTSRRTRSLSELTDPCEEVKEKPRLDSSCSTLSETAYSKGFSKWSFKDLFLFRSASDGRAMDRDPLKKYFRNSSLQSSIDSTKRRGRVSAHELHYTVNRAVSNDMKKKTFLPYKQGILGRLAFNPTVHALSNGFGFSNNS